MRLGYTATCRSSDIQPGRWWPVVAIDGKSDLLERFRRSYRGDASINAKGVLQVASFGDPYEAQNLTERLSAARGRNFRVGDGLSSDDEPHPDFEPCRSLVASSCPSFAGQSHCICSTGIEETNAVLHVRIVKNCLPGFVGSLQHMCLTEAGQYDLRIWDAAVIAYCSLPLGSLMSSTFRVQSF